MQVDQKLFEPLEIVVDVVAHKNTASFREVRREKTSKERAQLLIVHGVRCAAVKRELSVWNVGTVVKMHALASQDVKGLDVRRGQEPLPLWIVRGDADLRDVVRFPLVRLHIDGYERPSTEVHCFDHFSKKVDLRFIVEGESAIGKVVVEVFLELF